MLNVHPCRRFRRAAGFLAILVLSLGIWGSVPSMALSKVTSPATAAAGNTPRIPATGGQAPTTAVLADAGVHNALVRVPERASTLIAAPVAPRAAGHNPATPAPAATAFTPNADLSLTQSAFPNPVGTASTLEYTVNVANAGPDPATGVTVTDPLPAGTAFLTSTTSQGACSAGTTVSCTLGSLAAAGSATITIDVTSPATPGTVTNTATVAANESDPNPANNSATVADAVGGLPTIVVAAPPAVAMTGTASSAINVVATCPGGSTLVGGGSFLSRINGTTPGNGLKLNGSVPSDASGNPSVSTTTTPGSWTTVAGFGAVADSGDQARGFALCSTAQGPTATSVAVGPQVGTVTQGNAPAVSTASCPAGSSLIGGGALGTPASQSSFKPVASYPSNASGVPAGNGAFSPASWSAYGSAGTPSSSQKLAAYALCSTAPASLPTTVARVDTAGPQTASTFITATVNCPAGSRLLDGGTIIDLNGTQPQQGLLMRGTYPSDASGNPVTDTASNPSSWTDIVQAGGQNTPNTHVGVFGICAEPSGSVASADLAITLAASPVSLAQGSNVAFTGTVTNNGPNIATGAAVSDTLPAGLNFVSVTTTLGSCTNASGTLTCALGSLGAGTATTFTLVATASTPGTLTTTATVGADQPDGHPANNTASAAVTVSRTYSGAVLADGPLDFWRLNDTTSTVVDASGGQNGSYVSSVGSPTLPLSTPGATPGDPGNTGKRFVTSVGVSVAGAPGTALTGDCTFETWFQIPDNLGPDSINGMAASVSQTAGSWGDLYWYGSTGSATIQYLGRSMLAATMAYPGPSASQTWHHLALAISGNTAALYIDGALAASGGASAGTSPSGPALLGTDGGAVLGGGLQDVAIYNKALTPAQIATHISAATGP